MLEYGFLTNLIILIRDMLDELKWSVWNADSNKFQWVSDVHHFTTWNLEVFNAFSKNIEKLWRFHNDSNFYNMYRNITTYTSKH